MVFWQNLPYGKGKQHLRYYDLYHCGYSFLLFSSKEQKHSFWYFNRINYLHFTFWNIYSFYNLRMEEWLKNMSIKKILMPSKGKLLLFSTLFIGIHALNLALIFLIAGFWDGGLAVGFPIPFYTIGCGRISVLAENFVCNYGFDFIRLLINILFWYGVTFLIKRRASFR